MEDLNLQTTEGLIDRMHEVGREDMVKVFEWFMDEIRINDENEVTEFPEPENAPIDNDAARGLIISIIFGTHLEHEYPRNPESFSKQNSGEE